jgi:ABC-type glycerol-3-phosphate transport system permease component
VAVYSAVGQWNSWTDNFFLISNPKLNTLQLTLLNYLNQAEAIAQQVKNSSSSLTTMHASALSPMSVRMTMTMVVAIPIILVYPFMQKYFVKGIMIGAVKG